jgi:hypothetical protein
MAKPGSVGDAEALACTALNQGSLSQSLEYELESSGSSGVRRVFRFCARRLDMDFHSYFAVPDIWLSEG